MESEAKVYKKLKKEQTYLIMAMGGLMIALFIAFMVTIGGGKFTLFGVFLFALVIAVEIYSIIKLSKCSKNMDKIGMEIAVNLAVCSDTQKELKGKLIEIGIPRNFATNYTIRVMGRKIEEVIVNPSSLEDQREIKCPRCGSEKIRWIPYEKTSLGATFYAWLILSVLGYSFSTIVTMVMLILFVLAIIVRIIEISEEKKVNCYQCDMCGHKFETLKNKNT